MSSYSDWVYSVNRFLAGHGFLYPAGYYEGFEGYMAQAFDMGMTAQACARALAHRHEDGRMGRTGTGRGGPDTEPCGSCDRAARSGNRTGAGRRRPRDSLRASREDTAMTDDTRDEQVRKLERALLWAISGDTHRENAARAIINAIDARIAALTAGRETPAATAPLTGPELAERYGFQPHGGNREVLGAPAATAPRVPVMVQPGMSTALRESDEPCKCGKMMLKSWWAGVTDAGNEGTDYVKHTRESCLTKTDRDAAKLAPPAAAPSEDAPKESRWWCTDCKTGYNDFRHQCNRTGGGAPAPVERGGGASAGEAVC